MDLDEVKQDIPETKIENSRILFLDASSSCTGYSIVEVNFETSTAKLATYGAIWFPDVSHQEKYSYIYNALMNYFNIVEKIDYIVAEQYSINKDRMMGVMVSCELHGVIKLAAEEMGVKCKVFPPQSWKAALGIKKDETGTKEPTKRYITSIVSVPDTTVSNITLKSRQTPSDVYDALALGMGFLKKVCNIKHFDYNNATYQQHNGFME